MVDGHSGTMEVRVDLLAAGGADGGRILANWRAIVGPVPSDKRQTGVEDWRGSPGFASTDQTAVVATRGKGSTLHWTTIRERSFCARESCAFSDAEAPHHRPMGLSHGRTPPE